MCIRTASTSLPVLHHGVAAAGSGPIAHSHIGQEAIDASALGVPSHVQAGTATNISGQHHGMSEGASEVEPTCVAALEMPLVWLSLKRQDALLCGHRSSVNQKSPVRIFDVSLLGPLKR